MKLSLSVVIASVLAGALGACGSSDGGAPSTPITVTPDAGAGDDAGGTADAGTVDADPGPDHGSPSDTYPAFKPAMAQLVSRGGPVLKNPQIVTITWPGDTNAPGFEDFGDAIGGTKYWSSVVSEYGVGAAVSGATNHIRMTTALTPGITESDIDDLVTANASQQTAGNFTPDATKWPTPNANTLYVVYIPQAANFQIDQGTGPVAACGPDSSVGGYHSSTQTGSYVYAVIPECGARGTESEFDTSTESASHEFAEAAVDPQPGSGYYGLDTPHYVWSLYNARQTENGDMCEFYIDSFYKSTEASFIYQVQRQWSNASAAAGHAPCVPAPAGPYFNTTPLDLESINVKNHATQGYKLVVGQEKTFEIGFYSDAAMDPWTVTLHEDNPIAPQITGVPNTTILQYSIDKASGQNGEKAVITVKLKSAPTASQFPYLVVRSRSGSVVHDMPILVSTK